VLRTNLSTRPFYNERVVHLLIALAGVIVLTVTMFNVLQVIQLSRHNTELATLIGHDRSEAERLTRDAARIRRGINQKELMGVAAAAREAGKVVSVHTGNAGEGAYLAALGATVFVLSSDQGFLRQGALASLGALKQALDTSA